MHVTVAAEPEPIAIDLATAAVLIIDMQRDFLEPGGFGAALGNDVARLRSAIGPCERILELARTLWIGGVRAGGQRDPPRSVPTLPVSPSSDTTQPTTLVY
jgi:hypothetical protein